MRKIDSVRVGTIPKLKLPLGSLREREVALQSRQKESNDEPSDMWPAEPELYRELDSWDPWLSGIDPRPPLSARARQARKLQIPASQIAVVPDERLAKCCRVSAVPTVVLDMMECRMIADEHLPYSRTRGCGGDSR